jgi:hypothetical protein
MISSNGNAHRGGTGSRRKLAVPSAVVDLRDPLQIVPLFPLGVLTSQRPIAVCYLVITIYEGLRNSPLSVFLCLNRPRCIVVRVHGLTSAMPSGWRGDQLRRCRGVLALRPVARTLCSSQQYAPCLSSREGFSFSQRSLWLWRPQPSRNPNCAPPSPFISPSVIVIIPGDCA